MRFHNTRRATLPLAVLLVALAALSVPARAVSYTFTKLMDADRETTPDGIGNDGTIVGGEFYISVYAGFVYKDGVFEHYQAPDSDAPDNSYIPSDVEFRAINDFHEAVVEVDEQKTGTNLISTFSHTWQAGVFGPKTADQVIYQGINNGGTVVGWVYDSGNSHSFIGNTPYDYPGSSDTRLMGINNNGRIVGRIAGEQNGLYTAFYKDPNDSFPTVLSPPSPLIDLDAIAQAVNDHGDIVGILKDRAGEQFHGFLYSPGRGYFPVNYPNSLSTIPNGINNAGVIVGTYVDSHRATHGFVATPVPYTIDDAREALTFAGGLDTLQGVADPGFLDLDQDGRVTLRDAGLIMRKVGGFDENP